MDSKYIKANLGSDEQRNTPLSCPGEPYPIFTKRGYHYAVNQIICGDVSSERDPIKYWSTLVKKPRFILHPSSALLMADATTWKDHGPGFLETKHFSFRHDGGDLRGLETTLTSAIHSPRKANLLYYDNHVEARTLAQTSVKAGPEVHRWTPQAANQYWVPIICNGLAPMHNPN